MKNIQLISNLVFHFKNGSNQFTSLILQFNFLIFVLILISTLFNTATAQTWEIADANFDTDEKLYFDDMEFFNNDVGFILAFENDRMFKTTDGGYNWYTDYKLLDSRIGDFYKLNNQIGWIIYSTVDSSVLMKTTDAGESWESLTLPHIVSNIYFVNVQKGFLTGDTTFLKTTDGGTNWEEQIINIPGKTKRLHWIIPKFLNEDFGYALANNGEDSWSGTPFSYFLKTTNSEDDWEVNSFSSPMPISGFHLINFISEDVGILTHWAYLYYTIDGGDNWIKCNDSKFSSFFMNDFSFRNNECWMVGADGFIITSIDSGKTWLNQYSPTDESINSITFTEEKGIAISISNLLFYDLMVSVEDNI
ncbi:MAG: hypothetical protein K9G34_09045, partial [Melioribacteraceae bacterium]|nr:hypothetical protein [Melioribacteraceae bacterium]